MRIKKEVKNNIMKANKRKNSPFKWTVNDTITVILMIAIILFAVIGMNVPLF